MAAPPCSVSKQESSSHEPTISVARRSDTMQVMWLWFKFFAVDVCIMAAKRIPATLVADHAGSRAYLLASTAALLAACLTWPLQWVAPVAIALLLLPFAIFLAGRMRFLGPAAVGTFMTLYQARYDTTHCFWVAHCPCKECKGRVVGFVGAERVDRDTTELVRLFVSPRMRRQGLGRKFCQKVKQFAIAEGSTCLRLDTLAMFTDAIDLVTKEGYQMTNRVPYPPSVLASVTYLLDFSCELADKDAITSSQLSSHEPTISVAKSSDALQAVHLWFMHFGVWTMLQLAARVPAALVADHPGSHVYLLVSTTALVASLLACPLHWFAIVAAIVLMFPYVILMAGYFSYVVPTTIRTAKTMHRARYDSTHCFWVAHCPCTECKGQVVGLVGAKRVDRDTTELVRMFVSPRMRRQGLGRRLCQEVKQFAIASGSSRLKLYTMELFTDAVRLYTHQGYRLTTRIPMSSCLLAPVSYIVGYGCDL